MQTKQCKDCKHAQKRFNNGVGATTCDLVGRIVLYGHFQGATPGICPYLPFPESYETTQSWSFLPMKINAGNFSDVVKSEKIYTSKCFSDEAPWLTQGTQPIWKFVRIVEVEDEVVIFEVRTVEEIPRRITMASHGEGWHREVWEVEFELQKS